MSTPILIIGSVIPNIRGSVLKPCTLICKEPAIMCAVCHRILPNVYALTKVEC